MPADIRLNAEVPHVWFDIIGRILPGAFLLIGLDAEGCFPHGINCYIFDRSVPTVTLTFVLLGYISAAFMVGFLLQPLDHFLDELWNRFCPLTLEEFSPAAAKLLEDEFAVSKHDQKDTQSWKIWRARSASLHILWTHPTASPIATLASKRDAEKLASASFAWAGLILTAVWVVVWVLSCFGIGLHEPRAVRMLVLVLLSFVVGMSSLAYCHYRMRVVETPLDGLAEIRRQHEEHT